jgi:hypothetical protein
VNDRLPELPDAGNVDIQDHDVPLGGYLFHPQGTDTPAPAVMLLHGHGVDALDMAGAELGTAIIQTPRPIVKSPNRRPP